METGRESHHMATQYIMYQIIPSLNPFLDYNSLLHTFSSKLEDRVVEVDPFEPPFSTFSRDDAKAEAFVDILSMLYIPTSLNYNNIKKSRDPKTEGDAGKLPQHPIAFLRRGK